MPVIRQEIVSVHGFAADRVSAKVQSTQPKDREIRNRCEKTELKHSAVHLENLGLSTTPP